MVTMINGYSRYFSFIDSLEGFTLWIIAHFVSGCLKSMCNKFRWCWLHLKHLWFCDFSEKFGFRCGFGLIWTIISCKNLTTLVQMRFCKTYIIFQLSVRSDLNSHVYIFDCILILTVLYLFWQFELLFASDITWFKRLTPCFHIFLNAFCRYRLWKLSYGMRLNWGEEEEHLCFSICAKICQLFLMLFWGLSNIQEKIRLLGSFHKSLFSHILKILLRSAGNPHRICSKFRSSTIGWTLPVSGFES